MTKRGKRFDIRACQGKWMLLNECTVKVVAYTCCNWFMKQSEQVFIRAMFCNLENGQRQKCQWQSQRGGLGTATAH